MPKNRLSPHDRFIRSVFTNPKIVREFFEAHLPPKVKEAIDLNTIEPQKDSFIDDKLRQQISDILFATKFNNEDGYIYCLLEHASSPDKMLPLRLVKYMSAIIEQHLKKTEGNKLPIIYPLVLYTGQKPFPYSTDLFDLYGVNNKLAREIMGRPTQLIDLAQASDDDLKKYFWFGAAALIAKHIKDPDILPTLKVAIDLFRKIENLGEKQYIEEYVYVTLSYIVEAAEIKDKEAFIETIRRGLTEIDEDKIMTLAEQWKQEGLEKGRLEKELEIARSMILEGIDSQVIVKVTGLSQKQVSELIH
jgi:predicted transposase/invertase (TIGR01784 family)